MNSRKKKCSDNISSVATAFVIILCTTDIALCYNNDNISSTLKYVFAVTLEPAHDPTDYYGGPKVFGSSDNINQEGIYDMLTCDIFAKPYLEKFGLEKFTRNNFWVFTNFEIHNLQGAKYFQKCLLNKTQEVENKKFNNIEELEKFYFNLTLEFVRFYDKRDCPVYYEALHDMRHYLDRIFCKEFAGIDKCIARRFEIERDYRKLWLLSLAMRNLDRDVREDDDISDWDIMNMFLAPVVRKRHEKKLRGVSESNLLSLSVMGQQFAYQTSLSKRIRRTTGGRLLKYIMKTLELVKKGKTNEINPKKDDLKMSVFVAPTQVFIGLLSALKPKGTLIDGNTFNVTNFYPYVGATIVFELHRLRRNNWRVKVLYNQHTYGDFQLLTYRECNKFKYDPKYSCNWNTIKHIMEDNYMHKGKFVDFCRSRRRHRKHAEIMPYAHTTHRN
ncbi:uncharacterized protein LOC113385856 [Ctenocephalides felis]|uniref:uncharacterized protein LOC113385856 n=1 Tax=Ctenocephalides felis TaxID=7515 RepID=UPI000E6E4C93|nr:uncharacterized protein LOC113385856 [Ctenocephalides felis]